MRGVSRSLLILGAVSCLAACSNNGPAPVIEGEATSAGVHTVSSGDTLYSIAERYQVGMPEIVHMNHLHAPYFLEIGDRLDLPPPNTYQVRDGDSLYRISRQFDVSMTQLARQNRLQAPYRIKKGQTLRLPSAGRTYMPDVKEADGPQVASRMVEPVRRVLPVKTSAPKMAGGQFQWPVDGPIISDYGPKSGGLHNDGINIKAARGAPVRAAENGVVVYADDMLSGFGNLVLLRHEDRWMTAYGHMQAFAVRRGQEVQRGQIIGTVGSSGGVDKPQLHFEIRRGTEALDPKLYLGQQGS